MSGYSEDPTGTSEYAPSTGAISYDSDGDGIADTTVYDFDGDGIADAFEVYDAQTGTDVIMVDTDGDGVLDTAIADLDGDGTFETGMYDSDGDGWLDTALDPSTMSDTTTSTDDPFDTGSDDDTVHGDPMADIDYHQAQASTNDCLPTSVAMVLSEVTGDDVLAGDLVDLANELDVLGADGMSMADGVTLLEHYGVDAEVETGTLDDLREMLDADRPVIIGLDADDLYGMGDAPFADDMVSGHAVVITGIDDETGMVYINDPGFPDGAGVAIPIDEFADAWADSDNSMITIDLPEGTADDDGPFDTGTADFQAADTAAEDDLPDMAILPFTLKLF